MKLAWLNSANWLMHGLHLVGTSSGGCIGLGGRGTRLCVAVTPASRIVLGPIVGRLGYCVLTDWHWRIRAALGARDLPDTDIAFLLDRAGISARPSVVSAGASLVFVAI
jgi:hypothetical protein